MSLKLRLDAAGIVQFYDLKSTNPITFTPAKMVFSVNNIICVSLGGITYNQLTHTIEIAEVSSVNSSFYVYIRSWLWKWSKLNAIYFEIIGETFEFCDLKSLKF